MKTILPLFFGLMLCSCASMGVNHRYSASSAEDLYYKLITDCQRGGLTEELSQLKKLGPPPKMTSGKFIQSEEDRLNAYAVKLNAINFAARAKAPKSQQRNASNISASQLAAIMALTAPRTTAPAPVIYQYNQQAPTQTPRLIMPKAPNYQYQSMGRSRDYWEDQRHKRKVDAIADKLGVY